MIPSHHPEDGWLLSYAAGALDLGQHVAIATHLHGCARCRAWVRTMECVGGAGLADAAPADLRADALERTLSRLDEVMASTPRRADAEDADEGLPPFARAFAFGPWRKLGASIRTREIVLPEPSATRVLLLESKPGASVFAHTHGALEMTCVLRGAFRHAGGRFAAGDFDCAETDDHHEPKIEDGETCLCLVAIQGDLRWRGLLGRLVQPFIRL